MRRKFKLLIIIACLGIIVAVLAFNPVYAFRAYTPQSCTITNLPSHFLVIRYATFENWTNSQIVAEGEYVICQSHPDCKAYGCRTTDCYGDNGTHVLTGQRYTLYDGSYHDNTEWELKSNYVGVLVSDLKSPAGQYFVIISMVLVAIVVVSTPFAVYQIWKPENKENNALKSDNKTNKEELK